MTPDRPEDILERVRRRVQAHLGDHPVEVYLFGSWARGDPGRTSDIDVGVLPEGELPPGMLARLREDLAESRVPYPVEVVDLSTTDAAFRERVLREGVRWTA